MTERDAFRPSTQTLRFAWGAAGLIHLFVLGASWIQFSGATSHPTPFSPPIELRLHHESPRTMGAELAQALGEIIQSTTLKPRSKTLSNAGNGTVLEEYLLHWQQKVELVGNQLYLSTPELAKHQGDLRVLVTLDRGGSVIKCSIRQSNGDKILESIAQKIMAQAGPFPPLPTEVQALVDELEIIKTWSFRSHFGVQQS